MNLEQKAGVLINELGMDEFKRLMDYADKYAKMEVDFINRQSPNSNPILGPAAFGIKRQRRAYLIAQSFAVWIRYKHEGREISIQLPQTDEQIEESIRDSYFDDTVLEGEFEQDCGMDTGLKCGDGE